MTAFNRYVTSKGTGIICRSTDRQHFRVNPQVEAMFTGPVDGCSPFEERFQNQSLGVVSELSWYIDGVMIPTPGSGANPLLKFENPTHNAVRNHTVTLIAGNTWCDQSISKSFAVYPKPNATFNVDKYSGCQPLEVTFSNTSNTTRPTPNPIGVDPLGRDSIRYIFYYGDGGADTLYTATPSPPLQHSFRNSLGQNLPVRPEMSVRNIWGCTNKFDVGLTVFPYVKADFILEDSIGCSPLRVGIRNASQGYTTYQYSFGDGHTLTGSRTSGILTTHTYVNPSQYQDATYNLTLRVEAGDTGCDDVISKPVEVLARPVADFQPGSPYPGDFPHPVTAPGIILQNRVANDAQIHLNYLWTWTEQGSTNINIITTATHPSPFIISYWGLFDITMRVTPPNQLCTDSRKITIHIVPPPAKANFSEVPPDCMPYEVHFNNNSQYATAFRWDFGDGHSSTLENPTHVYAVAGTYNVTLIVTGDNITPDHFSREIVVHPSPIAAFEVFPNFLWVGQPLRAYNYTSKPIPKDGHTYDVWYRWNWGDGSPIDTEETPTHMYLKAGSYPITLTAGTYTDPVCESSMTREDAVDLENAGDIILPNIFKPYPWGEPSPDIQDRGYKNNLFYPPVISPVRKYHFVIYSRTGQLLFETTNPRHGWNGYFKGRICEEGVYTFKIEGVYETGQSFYKMGDVTLLR
jgi:PKD repeat protein